MRKRTGPTVIAVILLSVGLGTPAHAQEIRGTLRDVASGRPLPYGTIELITSDGSVAARTVSDEDGSFAVSSARPDLFQMRGWRIDADSVTDGPIELGAGDVREVDFLLALTAFELDPLDVTVVGPQRLERVGFYQREQLTTGVFMTRKQIDQGLRMTTTDVLARVPEIQVEVRLTPGSPTVMLRAGMIASARGGACYPVIYLNGAPVQQGGMSKRGYPPPLIDLETIPPEQIVGLEVYRSPAETPAQFSGISAACGVIVIWTG